MLKFTVRVDCCYRVRMSYLRDVEAETAELAIDASYAMDDPPEGTPVYDEDWTYEDTYHHIHEPN